MAREVEINIAALNGDLNLLTELAGSLGNRLKELKSSMDDLHAVWQGSAKQEFTAQFEKDYEIMMGVCTTVRELQNAMSYAKEEYTKCEQSVGDTVAAISI